MTVQLMVLNLKTGVYMLSHKLWIIFHKLVGKKTTINCVNIPNSFVVTNYMFMKIHGHPGTTLEKQ